MKVLGSNWLNQLFFTRLILLALIVVGLTVTFWQQQSYSLTYDEHGYSAAAVHIRCSLSLDTNKEVPPLSKIWMAGFISKELCPYTLPMNSPDRDDHVGLSQKFWPKVPKELLNQTIHSLRISQLILICFIFLLLQKITSNTLDKSHQFLSIFAVGLAALSPIFLSSFAIATTETVFILTLLMTTLLLQKFSQIPKFQTLALISISSVLLFLSKGSAFIFIPPIFALIFILSPTNLRKRNIFFFSIMFWVTLWLICLGDQFFWTPQAERNSYWQTLESWGSQSQLNGFINRLAKLYLLPPLAGIFLCFSLTITSGQGYFVHLNGRVLQGQTLERALLYLSAKVTLAEFIILFSSLSLIFLIIRKKETPQKNLMPILCLLAAYCAAYLKSEVKIPFRYLSPILALSLCTFPLFLSYFSKKRISMGTALFLAFQIPMTWLGGPNFLSHTNFLVNLLGGPEKNLSILDDVGQESDLIREAASSTSSRVIWWNASLPFRSFPRQTLIQFQDCPIDQKFVLATSSVMMFPPLSELLSLLTSKTDFRYTPKTGFLIESSCADLQFLMDSGNSLPFVKSGETFETPIEKAVVECQELFNDWEIKLCAEKEGDSPLFPAAAISYSTPAKTTLYFLNFKNGTKKKFCWENHHCRVLKTERADK